MYCLLQAGTNTIEVLLNSKRPSGTYISPQTYECITSVGLFINVVSYCLEHEEHFSLKIVVSGCYTHYDAFGNAVISFIVCTSAGDPWD